MKIKKFLTLTLSVLVTASMIGCSANKDEEKEGTKTASKEDKVITIGATANPHAEILEEVKPLLKYKSI